MMVIYLYERSTFRYGRLNALNVLERTRTLFQRPVKHIILALNFRAFNLQHLKNLKFKLSLTLSIVNTKDDIIFSKFD